MTTPLSPDRVIDLAIAKIGTRTELAVHLGISTSTLDKIRQGDVVPAKHCCELSRLVGAPLFLINPDVFDPDVWILSDEEASLIVDLRRGLQ